MFSDQDLERYRRRSDTPSPAQGPEQTRPGQQDTAPPMSMQSDRRFEVPYTPYEGAARRVIIQVRLNNSATARMLLDTGSPGMVIFDRLASRLGVFERNDGMLLTQAAGIGGSAPAILTIIESVQVGRAEDSFIPTVITTSLSDAFDGLIGMDFMANYSLRIDAAKRVVVFEEIQGRHDRPGGHDEAWWRENFRKFSAMRSEWKQYKDGLDKRKLDPERLDSMKRFADRQYREADKLFTKLNNYAAAHSVPMHWRQY